MDTTGSLLRIEKNGTQRITGRTGKVQKHYFGKFAFKNFSQIEPAPANGLNLFLNSAGAPVVLSTWGESAFLSNPNRVQASLPGGIREVINTRGNGDVALVTIAGIRIGRWVGPNYQQSMLIPGKNLKFLDIEYFGLVPK